MSGDVLEGALSFAKGAWEKAQEDPVIAGVTVFGITSAFMKLFGGKDQGVGKNFKNAGFALLLSMAFVAAACISSGKGFEPLKEAAEKLGLDLDGSK